MPPESPRVDELDPVVQNYGDLRDPYTGYGEGRAAGVLHENHLNVQVFRVYRHEDGQRHQQARGLIAHPFRPKVVASWEKSLIRPTAHEVIDRFAGRGSAELVREFAWQFPVRVFAKLLGIPLTDYEA